MFKTAIIPVLSFAQLIRCFSSTDLPKLTLTKTTTILWWPPNQWMAKKNKTVIHKLLLDLGTRRTNRQSPQFYPHSEMSFFPFFIISWENPFFAKRPWKVRKERPAFFGAIDTKVAESDCRKRLSTCRYTPELRKRLQIKFNNLQFNTRVAKMIVEKDSYLADLHKSCRHWLQKIVINLQK